MTHADELRKWCDELANVPTKFYRETKDLEGIERELRTIANSMTVPEDVEDLIFNLNQMANFSDEEAKENGQTPPCDEALWRSEVTATSPAIQHRKGMAVCPARNAQQSVPTSFNQIRVTQYRVILDAA